ncbi:MAG: DUF5681 domain-containing protein [Hyphomicrobiaceae bacterium]
MARKPKTTTKADASSPDQTGKNQGSAATQFKPGQSGNPNGRPKGSRSKLCEDFVSDLQTVWNETHEKTGKMRGIEALRSIAKERPTAFVAAVSQLVPKEFDLGDKTQAGFTELWRMLAKGKVPPAEPSEGDDE